MRCSELLRASRWLLFLACASLVRAFLFRSSYVSPSLHHAATAPRSAVAELGVVRRRSRHPRNMTPLIALAGLGGLSSEDELQFTTHILFRLVLWALFLPLITFAQPPFDPLPQWMVVLQPLLVFGALFGVHVWLRRRSFGLIRRSFIYLATYCTLTFTTNMAGPARSIFPLARDAFEIARLIQQGKGWPADTRP